MKRPADYANALTVVLIGLLLAILGNPIQTTQQRRHIPWWFWIILPCALLAWIFWWWMKRARQEQDTYYHISAPAATVQQELVPSELSRGEDVTSQTLDRANPPEETSIDDLTIIEGIGPKIAQMLYEQGITTFKALSEADPEQLRSLFRQAKLYFVDPTTWPEQAKLAAQGRWDELEHLKAQLTGGRRRSR